MPSSGIDSGVFALVGAALGAAGAIGAQLVSQLRVDRRERRGQLRAAYAQFTKQSFEYLHWYRTNAGLQELAVDEYYLSLGRDMDVDPEAVAREDRSVTLAASYAELRDAKLRLNGARCEVVLLERDGTFRTRTHHAFECLMEFKTFRVGDAAEQAFILSTPLQQHETLIRDVTDFAHTLSERLDLR